MWVVCMARGCSGYVYRGDLLCIIQCAKFRCPQTCILRLIVQRLRVGDIDSAAVSSLRTIGAVNCATVTTGQLGGCLRSSVVRKCNHIRTVYSLACATQSGSPKIRRSLHFLQILRFLQLLSSLVSACLSAGSTSARCWSSSASVQTVIHALARRSLSKPILQKCNQNQYLHAQKTDAQGTN